MLPKELILKLYEIQAIKFGSFTLKSGAISPVYLDLRGIVSFPNILKAISEALWVKIESLSFDLICGVPYTALPIATCISVMHDLPMVMRRKEAKDYGTKKMVEGIFSPGQSCLIIEDVVTSAGSILETRDSLLKEGLLVKDAITIVDREQGGKLRLENENVRLHSLFSLSEILQVLREEGKIDATPALV